MKTRMLITLLAILSLTSCWNRSGKEAQSVNPQSVPELLPEAVRKPDTVTLRSYETGGTKAIYHEAELYNMAYNLATLTPSGTNGNWGSRTLSSGIVRAVFDRGRNQSTYIRASAGYDITISTTDSKEIVGVILHYINGYSGGTITADTGSYSLSGTTGTWSGSATSIVLTPSSEARITSIEVLYKP